MMGLLIAWVIILTWLGHLVWLLAFSEWPVTSPWVLLSIAVQTYLYTGLFITAHDAMHGLVSTHRPVNRAIGNVATFLFAALSYTRLKEKHQLHHRYPGGADDPDFYTGSQNFFKWWFSFMRNYITWPQIIILAIVFNVLQIWIPQWKLLLFWILPSILSTFQLFYFGTYRPHRLPHEASMMPHHARSQKRSHWRAMISCYFFGYHFEHHAFPGTPWWKLYQIKNQYNS
jgi:beta-carotene ketolase (CrtW type)